MPKPQFIVRIPDNAGYVERNFNRIRGEDHWIGRKIEKDFPGHGKFKDTVNAVDDHEGHDDHRVFQVVYDDGDDEWVGVDDLVSILLPSTTN